MNTSFIGVRELFKISYNDFIADWKRLLLIQLPPFIIAILSIITTLTLGVVNDTGTVNPLYLLLSLASAIAYGLSWLALMWVVTHNNTKATWKDTYSYGWKYAWPAFGVGLLTGLYILGGFVLLIIPGIYLSVLYTFTTYAVFADEARGRDALKISKFYVKGNWWGVLGRSFLLSIVVGIVGFIIGAGSVGSQWETIMQAARDGIEPQLESNGVLDIISSSFSILFVTPFSTIFTYKMYTSLKELKGDFDPAK